MHGLCNAVRKSNRAIFLGGRDPGLASRLSDTCFDHTRGIGRKLDLRMIGHVQRDGGAEHRLVSARKYNTPSVRGAWRAFKRQLRLRLETADARKRPRLPSSCPAPNARTPNCPTHARRLPAGSFQASRCGALGRHSAEPVSVELLACRTRGRRRPASVCSVPPEQSARGWHHRARSRPHAHVRLQGCRG